MRLSGLILTVKWTLRSYKNLCLRAIQAGYHLYPVTRYQSELEDKFILLRHDVDRFHISSVKMARLEHEIGIRSSYYVRWGAAGDCQQWVHEIASLGHEIGYHYETLARTKGKVDRAANLFRTELHAMRQVVRVKTAAAHGSPLSKWNNLDIWDVLNPDELNLIEPYLCIDSGAVAYFTDTGRSWCADRVNLRDKTPKHFNGESIKTYEDLIQLLRDKKVKKMCIQTHPERWSYSAVSHARSLAFDMVANAIKICIGLMRS